MIRRNKFVEKEKKWRNKHHPGPKRNSYRAGRQSQFLLVVVGEEIKHLEWNYKNEEAGMGKNLRNINVNKSKGVLCECTIVLVQDAHEN